MTNARTCLKAGIGSAWLLASLLFLPAVRAAAAPEPPSERNFDSFRKDTWDATIKAAYPDGMRPSVWLLRRMVALFPGERTGPADLALAIARGNSAPDIDRFEALEIALSADPPPKEQAQLRLDLAKLCAGYNCPSVSLQLMEGLESGEPFDEATRKALPGLLAAWRSNGEDILALGRSYEAERLMGEADELIKRNEPREAAARLIRVALKFPAGYLSLSAPTTNQASVAGHSFVVGTGAHALTRLAALAADHPKAVADAAEIESPGLSGRAASGDLAAMEVLANVYGFTPVGWQASLRLAEEDLDAGRPALAELRFQAALQLTDDDSSKAAAMWRLAMARACRGDLAGAERLATELAAVAASGKTQLRLGRKSVPAADALALLRRDLAERRSAAGNQQVLPPWNPPLPVTAALPPDSPPPGPGQPTAAAVPRLSPRLIFSYHPALFDLKNRTSLWPRFWARPESLATIEGKTAFFHDSADLWALDWAGGALLWHYRSPDYLYELNHRARDYSNQIGESGLTSRGYSVAACPTSAGPLLCARFRRASGSLLFDLRCLRAGDGRLLWSTRTNPDLAELSYASDPVSANDRFYVMAYTTTHISTGYLVCLEPATGRVLFKTPLASNVDSFMGGGLGNFFSAHGGITVRDGKAYAATDRSSFVALDALTGSLLWIAPCDRVFARFSSTALTDHGTRSERGSIVERSHTPPLLGAKAAYFLAKDAPALFALDQATGRGLFIEMPRTAVEVLGEHNGLVIGAGRAGLFALRTGNGAAAWDFPLPLSNEGNRPSPWRSGFLCDGRIYWPSGRDVLVLSADDGRVLARWAVESPEPVTSIRPLPAPAPGQPGELAAFSSSGAVDRFMVLSAGRTEPIRLADDQESPDGQLPAAIDPATLSMAAKPADPAPPAVLAVPLAERPAPLPPLQLLWRTRFSHQDLFTGRYVAEIVDDPPRSPVLLAAAGDQLRCYRFDPIGEWLWTAPTPPAPQQIKRLANGRVCLHWSHGFEVYDLATGAREWGWSSASTVPREGAASEILDVAAGGGVMAVCSREVVSGVSVPDGRMLWSHTIVNNAYGHHLAGTATGILLTICQDKDYGGRSYLELLDLRTGKATWKFDLPKNTSSMLRKDQADLVWTRSLDNSRVSLVRIAPGGATEVWARETGPGRDVMLDSDRVFLPKADKVVALDSMTGKDVFRSPLTPKDFALVPGPKVVTFQSPSPNHGWFAIHALDRARGTHVWQAPAPGGNPPKSTPDQVLCPTAAQGGGSGYYWNYIRLGRLGDLASLDLPDGRMIGRTSIPGHNLWNSDFDIGHLAIEQRDNLVLLRSELGPVVLGSASLRPPGPVHDLAARLTASWSPANVRLIETMREDLMRHHPPSLGCDKVDRPPALDGEFDDWANARWVPLGSQLDWAPAIGGAMRPAQKRWGGPGDCAARFAVRHDGRTLYVAAEVIDDEFCPPPAEGIEAPGDSVEVGLSLGQTRDDAIQVDHDRRYPDIKVVLALVGNRPTATPVWYGQGAELAVSVRSGREPAEARTIRYEAAIPMVTARTRPQQANQIGFSLQINDSDRHQPKGMLRWAGGLGSVNANAQFGRLMLAPLSPGEIAQRRPVADLLCDAAVAWDQMRQIIESELSAGDAAAAAEEVKGFLKRHPGSYHASRALAWYEQALRLAGDASAAAKSTDLAHQLKVPELEQAEARARLFAQVKMDKGRHPQAVGMRFRFKGAARNQHHERGVYWGEDLGAFNSGMLYLGPMPGGDNIELTVSAELPELINKPVEKVMFMNLGGMAWWGDMGLIDGNGKRTVWLPAGARFDGKKDGAANWASRAARDGSAAHGPERLETQWTEHSATAFQADGLADANSDLELSGGQLPKAQCLTAAWLIPDNRLVLDLLAAADDAEEAARFARQFPASPLVPDVLLWIAARAGNAPLADQVVAEGKIPRQSCRDFYARLLPGIAAWQLIGPFSNEADVAQRRSYEPEQRVDLESPCHAGETDLRWKPAQAEEDGFININRAIESDEYQAAYAVAWVRAPDSVRGWLFTETPNVLSAWVESQRVIENAIGEVASRRGGKVEPVPVTLKSGWNRILLKVCNRYGYWGFRARLGNADGSKLTGLEYSIQQPRN